jgi:predicted phage tail protein
MDLEMLMEAVDHLSMTELDLLQSHIGQRKEHLRVQALGTPEERIAALRSALEDFRRDLDPEEWEDIRRAIKGDTSPRQPASKDNRG